MKHGRYIALIQHLNTVSGNTSTEFHALIKQAAEKYLNSLEKIISNEGKAQSCKLFKQLHTIAILIATEDYSFTPLPFRKSSKEGIPDLLKPVLPLLRSPNAS
jgi:hypothetical protein